MPPGASTPSAPTAPVARAAPPVPATVRPGRAAPPVAATAGRPARAVPAAHRIATAPCGPASAARVAPARAAAAAAWSSTPRPRAAPRARGPQQQPPRRRRGRRRRTPWVEPDLNAPAPEPQVLPATKINSGATVKEVAESLGLTTPEVIKKLMTLGEMATLTQTLTDEAIQVLADEFEKDIEIVHASDAVAEEPVYEDDADDLIERPPVVAVMGHVDHGKTSLLDAIRETAVASGEAGGITQHIGAYQVHHDDSTITFLDTPGHQAFTAMRARGAQVTDIAIIVVAADDGVMPQTREAIDHASAAQTPMLVAVNKIDKEGADPNRVRGELAGIGLTPADWGGDTEFVDVSAKTREGLDDLLENLVTLADLQELRSNPDGRGLGHGHRVAPRPRPRPGGHRARAARHADGRATPSWPAPTGAACGRCRTTAARA